VTGEVFVNEFLTKFLCSALSGCQLIFAKHQIDRSMRDILGEFPSSQCGFSMSAIEILFHELTPWISYIATAQRIAFLCTFRGIDLFTF